MKENTQTRFYQLKLPRKTKKKRTNGFQFTRRPTTKYENYSSNKFY